MEENFILNSFYKIAKDEFNIKNIECPIEIFKDENVKEYGQTIFNVKLNSHKGMTIYTKKIRFNILKFKTKDEVYNIIRHELCHYVLCNKKKINYRLIYNLLHPHGVFFILLAIKHKVYVTHYIVSNILTLGLADYNFKFAKTIREYKKKLK